eukprot:m.48692 g.48692  ORF g.48692 m.48692 type:complete len:50 (-) comp10577_c0_seq2:220-369(-)
MIPTQTKQPSAGRKEFSFPDVVWMETKDALALMVCNECRYSSTKTKNKN